MGARGPAAWSGAARRGSGRLRAARGLARPARPSLSPPPSPQPQPQPQPAATPAAAGRWPGARSAALRVTRPGGRDRRGPAGRGGVWPPPPLGPEGSPDSPGRPAGGWAAAGPTGSSRPGRCRSAHSRAASESANAAARASGCCRRRRLPRGRGAEVVAGRAEALPASVPSPRTPPPPPRTRRPARPRARSAGESQTECPDDRTVWEAAVADSTEAGSEHVSSRPGSAA